MKILQGARRLTTGSALVVLSACGDSPTAPGTGPVTAVMTPAGGQIDVVLPDGSELSLAVPAGAVRAPVSITLTPLAPAAGAYAAVALEPGGLLLARPATLTLTPSPSLQLPDPSLAAFAIGSPAAPRELIIATERQGAAFVAATPVLGVVSAPPGAAALRGKQDDEALIELTIANVQARIDALNLAIERLAAAGRFADAAAVQVEAAALAQLVGLDDQALAAFEAAGAATCEGLRVRHSVAAGGLEARFEALWDVLRPVLAWQASATALDIEEECPATDEFAALLSDLVVQYVELYTAAMRRETYPTRVAELEAELYEALDARRQGAILGLGEEFALIKSEIQVPLARRLRRAAYEWCRSDIEQTHLGRLFRAARDESLAGAADPIEIDGKEDFDATAEELQRDIEMCGTEVTWVHRAADGGLTAPVTQGGGALPGTLHPAAEVVAAPGGEIALSGLLVAFRCDPANGGDSEIGDDRIIVRFNGVDVRELAPIGTTSRFIRDEPLLLDVDEMLAEAGIDPSAGGVYPLTLVRTGSRCGGRYALEGEPGPLLTFQVRLGGPTASVSLVVTGNLSVLTQAQSQPLCTGGHVPGGQATSPSPPVSCQSQYQTSVNGVPVTRTSTADAGWTFTTGSASTTQLASFSPILQTSAVVDIGTIATGSGSLAVTIDVTGGNVRYEVSGSLSSAGSDGVNWERYARAKLSGGAASAVLLDVHAGRRRVGGGAGDWAIGPDGVTLDASGTLAPGRYEFTVESRSGDVSTGLNEEALAGQAAARPVLVLKIE